MNGLDYIVVRSFDRLNGRLLDIGVIDSDMSKERYILNFCSVN